MKVSAIISAHHANYDHNNKNEYEAKKPLRKMEKYNKNKLETAKTNKNILMSYNSAEYVKHAYEVSFRPLDMITNLQKG